MIAKHIDRFPLLKLNQVIDWQPIEQYLNRQKNRYLRDHRGRPAYPLFTISQSRLNTLTSISYNNSIVILIGLQKHYPTCLLPYLNNR